MAGIEKEMSVKETPPIFLRTINFEESGFLQDFCVELLTCSQNLIYSAASPGSVSIRLESLVLVGGD
jgi:hypothetical protein